MNALLGNNVSLIGAPLSERRLSYSPILLTEIELRRDADTELSTQHWYWRCSTSLCRHLHCTTNDATPTGPMGDIAAFNASTGDRASKSCNKNIPMAASTKTTMPQLRRWLHHGSHATDPR